MQNLGRWRGFHHLDSTLVSRNIIRRWLANRLAGCLRKRYSAERGEAAANLFRQISIALFLPITAFFRISRTSVPSSGHGARADPKPCLDPSSGEL